MGVLAGGLCVLGACKSNSNETKTKANQATGSSAPVVKVPAGWQARSTALFVQVSGTQVRASSVAAPGKPAMAGPFPGKPVELANLSDRFDAHIHGANTTPTKHRVGAPDDEHTLDRSARLDRLQPRKPAPHAPLLITARNQSLPVLVDIVRALCSHGARLAPLGSASVPTSQHPVRFATLQPDNCRARPPLAAGLPDKAPPPRPPAGPPRAVVVLTKAEAKVGNADLDLKVVPRTRDGIGHFINSHTYALRKGVWLLVGDRTTAQDLKMVLNAVHGLGMTELYLAPLSALPPKAPARKPTIIKKRRLVQP